VEKNFGKMKLIFLSLAFIVFLPKEGLNCSCSIPSGYEVNVQGAFENSFYIVIANSIGAISDSVYTIKITEYLKGEGDDTINILLSNSCSFKLDSNELWLLYLEKDGHGFTTNECLPNRIFPKMNLLSFPPPQNDSGVAGEPYLRTILLYQELISLRQKKLLNQVNRSTVGKCSNDGFEWPTMIGLCITILLLLLLLFKRR
jgi:hypothetical protein